MKYKDEESPSSTATVNKRDTDECNYQVWILVDSTIHRLLIKEAALEHLLQVIVKVLGIVLRVFNIQVLPDIFVVFVIIRLLDIFRIGTMGSRPEIINIIINLIPGWECIPKRIIIEGGRKVITGSVVVVAGTHSERIKGRLCGRRLCCDPRKQVVLREITVSSADVVTTIVVALVQKGIYGAHWGSRKVCEIRKVNIRILAQIVLVQLQVHHTLGPTTSTATYCRRGRAISSRWPSTNTAR